MSLPKLKSSAPKRVLIGFNVILQVLLAAAIVVVVNMAIHRWHPHKMDLMRTDYYRLGDKTRNLLKSIKSPVEVYVFFQNNSPNPVVERISEDVQLLLKEYEEICPLIKVKYVDPDRDLLKGQEFLTKYDVKEANVVIFVYDKRNKFVKANDLVEFDRSPSPFSRGDDKIRAFKGEQMFTSAIQSVMDPKQPKVYFLEGQGEGDPTDTDEKSGCSDIASYIQQDNLSVQKLNIVQTMQIPANCDLLVICGPEKPFGDVELKAIQDYLAQNGRLMVMLDAMKTDPGLERILAEHGVKIGNDVVLMRDPLGGERLTVAGYGVKYANHLVTQSLKNKGIATEFPMARSVDKIVSVMPNQEHVTVLVETPSLSWAETDLVKLQQGKAVQDEKDRKGPVPIAVAVEPASAGEMEREGMRLVVFGSSRFIRNGYLKSGNEDLFMSALNWLIKRPQLVGISAKKPTEFSVTLTPRQANTLYLIEILGLPIAVGLIGILVWVKSRK